MAAREKRSMSTTSAARGLLFTSKGSMMSLLDYLLGRGWRPMKRESSE